MPLEKNELIRRFPKEHSEQLKRVDSRNGFILNVLRVYFFSIIHSFQIAGGGHTDIPGTNPNREKTSYWNLSSAGT